MSLSNNNNKLIDFDTKQPRWLMAFVDDIDGKAAINEEERSILAVISSDQLDRDKEIVASDAIAKAMKGFAANPVALACHQHRLESGKSPVVGRWDTDTFKQSAHSSQMKIIFASTELAEEYWQLYKGGFMRAFSIGFSALKWHQESDNQNGLHYIIDEIELYEISCVPVGSNRQALAKIKALGIDTDFYEGKSQAPDTADDSPIIKSISEKVSDIESRLTELSNELYDSLEEIKSLLITGHGATEPDSSDEPDESQSLDDSADESKSPQLEQIAESIENLTLKIKES